MLSRELAVAESAARAAGRIAEAWRSASGNDVREKKPGHPVTEADIAADREIRRIIEAEFPDDGWLSEETADSPERLAKDRVWIVDPIDGTKEFIKGLPEYVVSIALAVRGEPVLGAVYQPTSDRLFTGRRSFGARVNGATAAPRSTLGAPPRILVSRTETARGNWATHAHRFDLALSGSIAYKLCRAAVGECDGVVTLESRSEWDIAGGIAVLEAAGGRATDHRGRRFTFNREKPVTETGLIAGSGDLVSYTLATCL